VTALRWGILGTARVNRHLLPAMRAARRSSVVAVASRDLERGATFAREWDIPTAHDGYDGLLRDRSVDAVYIPLPNALHVEWTLRALDAGKHVLCEKPLALAADDVDRIEVVARGRGLVVAEAFMYRHKPLVAAVVELLRSGAIGPIGSIAAGFTYQQTRSPDVRLDADLGGGSLWDVGCYAVSIARLAVGREPRAVFGVATPDGGVDVAFHGLLQFEDGIVASVQASFRAPYRGWLEVTGSSGLLRVSNPFKAAEREAIEIVRGDDVERVEVENSTALFVHQVEDFVSAVNEGRSPLVSLRESRGNAAALAALHQSARANRPVTI
jgi:predicted dehydrogenase